ncbi:MAG TPA: DNA recombination protein RmuC, partial [Chlamydiales bacterium]|nr:DNA recombination protein RmuC [Chlamydiales bacterium]
MEFVFALLFFLTFATLLWHVVQKKLAVNQEAMKESFKALSHEVTELNSRIFLELAKGTLERYQDGARVDLENRQKAIDGLLTPVKETMKEIDAHQREMEKVRASSYGSLSKQIDSLMEAQRDLRKETATLAQSLRSPHIRGSWGEIHLRRVVELAGLLNHCDFFEQKTIDIAGRI